MATTNIRSIDNIEINGTDFKHLETTKDIVATLKNEYGRPARPDTTHKWTAKVSDGANYVGDYAVKINATSLIVDSEDFTKLPVGNYQLEVWEQWTDADGTSQLSIYPSPKQTIPFNIYANIPDQAGKEVKEIGFQDVVDQAVMNIGMNYVFKVNTIDADQTATVVQAASGGKNYVTFNIPRGAQGPVGQPLVIDSVKVTKLDSSESPSLDYNAVPGNPGHYTFQMGIPVGAPGKDGYTPVRGTDYWTDADKQTIQADVTQMVGDAYTKASNDVANQILNGKW